MLKPLAPQGPPALVVPVDAVYQKQHQSDKQTRARWYCAMPPHSMGKCRNWSY